MKHTKDLKDLNPYALRGWPLASIVAVITLLCMVCGLGAVASCQGMFAASQTKMIRVEAIQDLVEINCGRLEHYLQNDTALPPIEQESALASSELLRKVVATAAGQTDTAAAPGH
jgi:hypothetical protein